MLSRFYSVRRFTLGLVSAWAVLHMLAMPSGAVAVDAPLPDARQEQRARAISHEIRCLVCQNQSIEDSNAPLASDLRQIVRERIAAGDSDEQVRQYLVSRYGDWVLLNPPFNTRTIVLWLLPGVLAVFAASGAVLYFRRRRTEAAMTQTMALSAEERAELDRLLGPDGRKP